MRKRYDEAQILFANGYHEAALVLLLICIAAASRIAVSKKNNGNIPEPKRDKKWFVEYLNLRIQRVENEYTTSNEVLYEQIRCPAIHEAKFPETSYIEKDVFINIDKGKIIFGKQLFNALSGALIFDPNLRDDFRDLLPDEENIVEPIDPGEIENQKEQIYQKFEIEYKDVMQEFFYLIKAKTPERLSGFSHEEMRKLFRIEILPHLERIGWNGGVFTAFRGSRLPEIMGEGPGLFDKSNLPTEIGYQVIVELSKLYKTVDPARRVSGG